MDLNALLNINLVAVDQPKKGENSRNPSRSRTPWDAGGYSLPINTLSKTPTPTIPDTLPESGHYDHSKRSNSTSPRHRAADSGSIVSSNTFARTPTAMTPNTLPESIRSDDLGMALATAPAGCGQGDDETMRTRKKCIQGEEQQKSSPTECTHADDQTHTMVKECIYCHERPGLTVTERMPGDDQRKATPTECIHGHERPATMATNYVYPHEQPGTSPTDYIHAHERPGANFMRHIHGHERPKTALTGHIHCHERTNNALTPSPEVVDDSRTAASLTRHKRGAGSRSSLSSSTSSTLSSTLSSTSSQTHSRFSSISTLSHPLNTLIEQNLSPRFSDLHQPFDTTKQPLLRTTSAGRPSSPSDAILIRRTTTPGLRVETGVGQPGGPGYSQQNNYYLSAPLQSHYKDLVASRSHKRTYSAPNSTGSVVDYAMEEQMPQPPRGEPTPPPSHHPEHSSSSMSPSYQSDPESPPATASETQSAQFECMFTPDCDTGSQPRKAISHIFGRNKMCTRQIPEHVWVVYCRKHYQRSRYRNPKLYSRLQCDLVFKQINMIQEWSQGHPQGPVKDWSLAVRKREQKRLEDLGSNRKRKVKTLDKNDDEIGDNGEGGNKTVPTTAVPPWLLAKCGTGYSTDEILEIFKRLHRDILADPDSCFPDIEILPNIVMDDKPKVSKGYTKRPSGTNSHQRSKSLGLPMSTTHHSSDHGMSQSSVWGSAEASNAPAQKRRRPNGPEYERSPDRLQRSGLEERHFEAGRGQLGQVSTLPAPTPQRLNKLSMAARLENGHRYATGAISAHVRSQSDMSASIRGRSSYAPSPYPVDRSTSPFPPMASHNVAPTHNRGSSYQYSGPSSQYPYPPTQQQSHPSSTNVAQHPIPPITQRQGHSRHQSIPLAPQTYAAHPSSPYAQHPQGNSTYYSAPPLPPPQRHYAQSSEYQHSQGHNNQSSGPQQSRRGNSKQPSEPHITEDEETRDLYRSRR